MMTTRELELLQRAEAAERAVIEAVRQRDIALGACKAIVNCINATGGLVEDQQGFPVPAADQDWLDLGEAYMRAGFAISQASEQVQP